MISLLVLSGVDTKGLRRPPVSELATISALHHTNLGVNVLLLNCSAPADTAGALHLLEVNRAKLEPDFDYVKLKE